MLRNFVFGALAAVWASCQPTAQQGMGQRADLNITQRHLVALCLDGRAVEADQRRWRLDPGEHTLAFTMRNDPRSPGDGAGEQPGRAVVQFRAEPGHGYEVEIRADSLTYSRRVWKEREWKPVVRDRRPDALVSSEPTWMEAGAQGCE